MLLLSTADQRVFCHFYCLLSSATVLIYLFSFGSTASAYFLHFDLAFWIVFDLAVRFFLSASFFHPAHLMLAVHRCFFIAFSPNFIERLSGFFFLFLLPLPPSAVSASSIASLLAPPLSPSPVTDILAQPF